MGMKPEDFFEEFVKGNFSDFKNNEYSIRYGFNAAIPAFHLADHYFKYCKKNDPNKVSKFKSREDYLKYLSIQCNYLECPHCKKPVPNDSLRCLYCGDRLDVGVGFLSGLSNAQKGLLISVIAVLLIAAFLLWLL